MLHTEQYNEALEMLTFLLQFPTADQQIRTMGSSAALAANHVSGNDVPIDVSLEEDLEEETDLLRQYIQDKDCADDGAFVRLSFNHAERRYVGEQVNALEQLAFIEQSDVSQFVKDWLCEKPRHPHLQFKALADA